MTKNKILIVDDDKISRIKLSRILQLEGYDVLAVNDGQSALLSMDQERFDLMIIDLQMPGISGLELLRLVKEKHPEVRVIILTAHGSLDSAISAIRDRAFDYILKQEDPERIVNSVKRVLDLAYWEKNIINESSEGGYAVGNSQIIRQVFNLPGGGQLDWNRRLISLGGKSVYLTPTEMRVFEILLEHLGGVVRYSELVSLAQGYEANSIEAAQILRPVFSRLRQKLFQLPGAEDWIQTVRGSGYIMRF